MQTTEWTVQISKDQNIIYSIDIQYIFKQISKEKKGMLIENLTLETNIQVENKCCKPMEIFKVSSLTVEPG